MKYFWCSTEFGLAIVFRGPRGPGRPVAGRGVRGVRTPPPHCTFQGHFSDSCKSVEFLWGGGGIQMFFGQ